MKKITFITLLLMLLSFQGNAQFWINFGWGEPNCRTCDWMERALRMTPRQARDYNKIVHRYGEKIERETRRPHKYWDDCARHIYDLRIERDRRLQRILSPNQFRSYIRYSRENPTRIHDWRGWYNNPHYPTYRPSRGCHRYEDHYWHSEWEYRNNKWYDHFDSHSWSPNKYPNHNNNYRPDTHLPQIGNSNRPNGGSSSNRPGVDHQDRPNGTITRPSRPSQPSKPSQSTRPSRPGNSESSRPSQQTKPSQQTRPSVGQGRPSQGNRNETKVDKDTKKERDYSSSGRTSKTREKEKKD